MGIAMLHVHKCHTSSKQRLVLSSDQVLYARDYQLRSKLCWQNAPRPSSMTLNTVQQSSSQLMVVKLTDVGVESCMYHYCYMSRQLPCLGATISPSVVPFSTMPLKQPKWTDTDRRG